MDYSLEGFSRQEYWSGLPFPPPGDPPDPETESVPPVSPSMAGRFFTTDAPGKPQAKVKPRKVELLIQDKSLVTSPRDQVSWPTILLLLPTGLENSPKCN